MENHGFKFIIGLNIDTITFDPISSCGPDGIYFYSEHQTQ
jgi:hypothetical protein